jgi:hypothetical protein
MNLFGLAGGGFDGGLGCFFDDANGARRNRLFLGEILVANLLGQLFRDGV